MIRHEFEFMGLKMIAQQISNKAGWLIFYAPGDGKGFEQRFGRARPHHYIMDEESEKLSIFSTPLYEVVRIGNASASRMILEIWNA